MSGRNRKVEGAVLMESTRPGSDARRRLASRDERLHLLIEDNQFMGLPAGGSRLGGISFEAEGWVPVGAEAAEWSRLPRK